ncbi:hypothetical protein BG004_000158 [Podila humilis]|nr:hypothetical protein BG004_000158 [Podila humilis]
MSSDSGTKQDHISNVNGIPSEHKGSPKMQQSEHDTSHAKANSQLHSQSTPPASQQTSTPPNSNSRPSPRPGSKPRRGGPSSVSGDGSSRSPSARTSGSDSLSGAKGISDDKQDVNSLGLGITNVGDRANESNGSPQGQPGDQNKESINTGAEKPWHQRQTQPTHFRGRGGRVNNGDRHTDRPHHISSHSGGPPSRFASRGGRHQSIPRGGDEDDRGRRYERKADQNDANRPTGHSGDSKSFEGTSASWNKSEPEPSESRPTRPKESQIINEVKKTHQATRSPKPPRSPRRGFNERGSEYRDGSQSRQAQGSEHSTLQPPTDSAIDNVEASSATSKKRKGPRKNKKKDEDENSIEVRNGPPKYEDRKPFSSQNKSTGASPVESDGAWIPKSRTQRHANTESSSSSHYEHGSSSSQSKPPNISNYNSNNNNTYTHRKRDELGYTAEKSNWNRDHKHDSRSFSSPRHHLPKNDLGSSNSNHGNSGWDDTTQPESDQPIGWEPAKETSVVAESGWGEPPKHNNNSRKDFQHESKDSRSATQNHEWGDRSNQRVNGTDSSSGWGEAPKQSADDAAVSTGWGEPPKQKGDDASASTGWGEPSKQGAENTDTSTGWGEQPKQGGESAEGSSGWGESSVSNMKWGEDIPWEKTAGGLASTNTSEWNQESRGTSFERQGRGTGFADRGRGRGGFNHTSFTGRPHDSQQVRERDSRDFQDSRSSLSARTARQEARGTRSSAAFGEFDKRDERLEQTVIDGATTNDGEKSTRLNRNTASRDTAEMQRTTSHSSADVRLDARYNNEMGHRSYARNGPGHGSKPFVDKYEKKDSHSSGFLPPDSQSRPPRTQDAPARRKTKPPRVPMFSTSLECQMTWDVMDLKPNVLASIKKAGLIRPSNIQKLAMHPIGLGKDVIAQSQSQKDRTNTLAIALLQKLSSENKACQAVVICSDGVNPQKVHEDIQEWFQGSGLTSIFLNDASDADLSDTEKPRQAVITTLGPLMEVLNNSTLDMKAVDTVVISMRSDELLEFSAFKQFWALLPNNAQVILMTGQIQPAMQQTKDRHFRSDAVVLRADELTLQWSEHYYINVASSDARWDVLVEIFNKNPAISHVVILTQSQSLSQGLATKLCEMDLPAHAVWSMADKTEVARMFNRPEKCILVAQSILMDHLDLDHFSLVINYDMPKRDLHYIANFGPFGRSGLRTMMINFVQLSDPTQQRIFDEMEAMYHIKIKEMKLE